MTTAPPDIVDLLTDTAAGSPIAILRDERPETKRNAQASYDALFSPEVPGDVSAVERFAVAAYLAALHRDTRLVEHYDGELRRALAEAGEPDDLADVIAAEAARSAATGPFGHYGPVGLTRENTGGLRATTGADVRGRIGARLAAALDHTHLLVFRPRESDERSLDALLAAGWSATDVVTLSQLISFLAFQARVVAGLRVLSATATADSASTTSIGQ